VLQLLQGKLRTVQVLAQGELVPQRFPDVTVNVSSVWPE
jgi:hypothetical protein